MEIRAYPEIYLPLAQRILGDTFDFAFHAADMDADDFMRLFLASGYAEQFQKGNVSVVAGITGCELVRKVFSALGMTEPDADDCMLQDKSEAYWSGWALAYYQWYSTRPFTAIHQAVSMREILKLYPTCHEADISRFVSVMEKKVRTFYRETRLKSYRNRAGLSQRELAEASGVALRQIQLFEQKERDINKTQAINLYALGKVLRCSPEALLEL